MGLPGAHSPSTQTHPMPNVSSQFTSQGAQVEHSPPPPPPPPSPTPQ
ncbi:MAG TPA: hypothetical protein VK421_04850 [Pyrinomonadaceae bacterium]|nr:hypothetical protein [Pyrinomonadaceae bacterium]